MKELIIYIHERAVRIIYQYFISSFQSFQKLHLEDNSLNIHHKYPTTTCDCDLQR